MKIPYNKTQLQMALITISSDDLEKTMKKVTKEMQNIKAIQTKKDLNKTIAESNDITISELIASQNYQTLVNEFKFDMSKKFIALLKENGLTDIQAWAVYCAGTDLIKP